MTPPAPVTTGQFVALAASAFVVLAAEPLYLLVDTAVVGHLGAVELAGLGLAATLMSLLTLVGAFLAYGTTARAARWFGAGERDRAVNEGVQATWLAVGLGIAAFVVGEALAGPLTRLLAGGGTAAQAAAEQWLRIALLGVPGVLIALAGNGWLRGVQDTRTPVRIVLLANGVSAVLSPVLVYPVGLGLPGSAVANVVAQVLAGTLFVRALRRATVVRRPQWALLRRQLSVGRDLLVRSAGLQASFLVAAGVAARLGTAQVAAHQIALQLWLFLALLLDSFAIAAQSLVGAALGGSDPAGARATAWRVGRLGLVAGVGAAVLVGAGWTLLPAVFTTSLDVRHQASLLWPWFVAMMPAAGVVFALDGVLMGAGDVGFLRTLTLVAAVGVYLPLALLALHFRWGIGGVWAGLAAFIGVRLAGVVWRVLGRRWLVLGAVQ